MSALSATQKQELLERFSRYLDGLDQVPEPEKEIDHYRLFTELAGLRNEVRLESRQLKTALDQFRSALDLAQSQHRLLTDWLQERRDGSAEHHAGEVDKELLLDLLDLWDRLDAAVRHIERRPKGWRSRVFSGSNDLLDALHEGLTMLGDRLAAILASRDTRQISCLGQPFDPRTMRAVEVSRRSDLQDGVVCREIRAGFMLGEHPLRHADVCVNRTEG